MSHVSAVQKLPGFPLNVPWNVLSDLDNRCAADSTPSVLSLSATSPSRRIFLRPSWENIPLPVPTVDGSHYTPKRLLMDVPAFLHSAWTCLSSHPRSLLHRHQAPATAGDGPTRKYCPTPVAAHVHRFERPLRRCPSHSGPGSAFSSNRTFTAKLRTTAPLSWAPKKCLPSQHVSHCRC